MQYITVTIGVANDRPVITAIDTSDDLTEVLGTAYGADADTADGQNDLDPARGTVTIVDLDDTDRVQIEATFKTIGWSDGNIAALLGQAQIDALKTAFSVNGTFIDLATGKLTTFLIAVNASNEAQFNWAFTTNNTAGFNLNALAEGETITLTYDLKAIDDSGASNDTSTPLQTVTVTITGTNDVPLVAVSDVTGAVTEEVAPGNDLTDSGTIAFTDVDLTDSHSIDPVITASDGALGSLTASVTTDTTGTGTGGVITWNYTVADADVEYLAEGQTKIETFTITLDDGNGGTVDRTVSVTITGTNDVPLVAVSDVTGAVTEEVAPGNDLTDSGTIAFTDVDLTDSHSIDPVITASDGALGSLTASVTTDTTGTGTGGVITWNYTVADADVEYLAEGQTKIETFTITLDDGNGGTVDRTVSVTITGTNDVPLVAVSDVTGAVTEEVAPGNDLTDSGTIAFTDVDLTDSHSIDPVITASDGALGSLTASVTTDTTGTGTGGVITWNYTVADADVEYLAEGQTKIETFTITLDDGNGGTVERTISVTITGTNDTATITASGGDHGNVTEDALGQGLTIGSLSVLDPDNGEANFQPVAAADLDGQYGAFTFDSDTGAWSYVLDHDKANGLSATDVEHEVLTITSADGTATHNIDVTVYGTNDAPVVTSETFENVAGLNGLEDTALVIQAADLLANDTDADTNTALHIVSVGNTSAGATVTLDDNGSIIVTPAANYSGPVTFDYTVDDGSDAQNATAAGNVTVNFAPVADAPLLNVWVGFPSDSDLTPQAINNTDIQVNTTTTDNEQQYPSVAALNDGGFVIVWSSQGEDGSGWGVFGQRYDANGNTIDGEFQVNTYTIGDQRWASVAALEDGGFVVAWTSRDQDGSNDGIYAQRFDADGDPIQRSDGQGGMVNDEFLVNTTTGNYQNSAHVTTLFSNGGFLVTWQSIGNDDFNNPDWGVFGRIFNPDGNPVPGYNSSGELAGGEFQINSHVPNDQMSASAAGFADGSFVVVWQSGAQDGNDGQGGNAHGIYGQRYDDDGHLIGGEFAINTETALEQIYPSVATLETGGFVVAWATQAGGHDNFYDIAVRLFDANGDAVGDEFRVHGAFDFDRNYPTVVALDDGGFVITWSSHQEDGSTYGVFGQRFDSDGNMVGNEFLLNNTTDGFQIAETWASGNTTAVLTDGTLVSAWSGTGTEEVFARLFSIPQDGAYVNISAALTDNDGSELLAITLAGLPVGFTITDFGNHTEISNGVDPINITDWNLSSLFATTSPGFDGVITVVVEATSTEGNGATASTTNTLIFGTSDNDTLTGGPADNISFGFEGNDILTGGGTTGPNGWDVLFGGDGNDELTIQGFGAMFGEAGRDTLRGIASSDPDNDFVAADYSNSPSGIVANLTNDIHEDLDGGDNIDGFLVEDGWGYADHVAGVHELQGSNYADKIFVDDTYLNSLGNWIEVRPGGGDDAITFENVAHARISYRDAPNAVLIDMENGTATDLNDGDTGIGHDTFSGANQARGTEYADKIYGSYGDDERLRGGGGDDLIDGRSGDDRIEGESGNDTLIGGEGADTLIGGDGHDTFVFLASTDGNLEVDQILDFNTSDDIIDINDLLGENQTPDQAVTLQHANATDTTILVNNASVVDLIGVHLDNIAEVHFAAAMAIT